MSEKPEFFRSLTVKFQKNDAVLAGGLLILSFLLYVLNLGSVGLWGKHEALYAEVAREMLIDGNWIIPHFDGDIYIEKPPLYFWMVALCSMPVGDVNEFTARMPAALCAMGTVMVTFFFGRKLFNTRVAFFGALILATCLFFVVYGRRARLDTTFTFFISSSLLAFYSGYTSNKKIYYFLLFWFLIALAVLTKGLFALFLVLSSIVFYLLWNNDLKALLDVRFVCGGGAFVLAIAAWLLPAYFHEEGNYLKQFIFVNSGLRYVIPLTETRHHHSLLRYTVGYLLLGMVPWSIFLIVFFCRFFAKKLWKENRQLSFPSTWFFAMLFIFIMIGGKRSTYFLPLYPPTALLIATWWDELLGASPNFRSSWPIKVLGCSLIIMLGIEIVWICQGISTREMVFIALTIFSMFGFGTFLLYSRYFKELFVFLFLIAVSVGVSYNYIFLPHEEKSVLRQAFFKELNSSLGQCSVWATYGDIRRDVLFYSKVRPRRINSIHELEEFVKTNGKAYWLMSKKDYSLLASRIPMHIVNDFSREDLLLVSN